MCTEAELLEWESRKDAAREEIKSLSQKESKRRGRRFSERAVLYHAYINNDPIWVNTKHPDAQPWQEKRLIVLERDKVCRLCGDPAATHVHHLRYQPEIPDMWSFGLEGTEILTLLCAECHLGFHEAKRSSATFSDDPEYEDWIPVPQAPVKRSSIAMAPIQYVEKPLIVQSTLSPASPKMGS